MRALAAALLMIATALPALADCPLDLGRGTGIVVFSQHFIIALRPDPLQLEVGQPFSLILNVCTKSGEPAELVSVDGQLDEKTPMKGALTVVPGANGRFRAEGLMMSEPGWWEIGFNVREGKDSERLSHDLVVK